MKIWKFIKTPLGFKFSKWEPTWECASSFLYILLHSWVHKMWFSNFPSTHTFASLYLDREPKARVTTTEVKKVATLDFNWVATPMWTPINTKTPFEPKQTTLLTICSTIIPPYSSKDFKINKVKLFEEFPPITLSRFSNDSTLLKPST